MANIMEIAKQELPALQAIMALNHKGSNAQVLAIQELEYLQNMALSKPEIAECHPQSIVAAIKGVLKQNLTLDPNAGLVYVKTRNVKLGNGWVKVLEIQPSANGIISMKRQCGRLFDIERPKILKDDKGRVISVKVKYQKPGFDDKRRPIAVWVEEEFDESDFQRWRSASHRENARGKDDAGTRDYSNPLYRSFNGGPDPEFIRAKGIKHALTKDGANANESIAIHSMQQPVVEDADFEYEEEAEDTAPAPVHVTVHDVVTPDAPVVGNDFEL